MNIRNEIILLVIFISLITGCKKNDPTNTDGKAKTIHDLLVKEGEIAGWTYSGSNCAASSIDELYGCIDGAAPIYQRHGFIESEQQSYQGTVNSTAIDIKIEIYNQGTAENALALYNDSTKSSAAFLASQVPSFQLLDAEDKDSLLMPIVWEAEGISDKKVSALLEALGGIDKLLTVEPARATIVIKPNICLPDGALKGTTTSYSSVELFCKWFISQGVKKIIITDHTLQKASDFTEIDLTQLPKNYPEIKLMLANEERMYEAVDVHGKVLKKVDKLKLISKADLFLNFATAKHHASTHVSLCLKNLMGTIWNRADFHTRMDIDQAIGDLALVIRPAINVIDANRVLLNGGPTGPGPLVKDNRLFACRDIVAVDSVVSSRYNFAEKSLLSTDIAHLKAAAGNGVGEISLDKIVVKKV
jgi:uncharacterized protein (DUF362 family)